MGVEVTYPTAEAGGLAHTLSCSRGPGAGLRRWVTLMTGMSLGDHSLLACDAPAFKRLAAPPPRPPHCPERQYIWGNPHAQTVSTPDERASVQAVALAVRPECLSRSGGCMYPFSPTTAKTASPVGHSAEQKGRRFPPTAEAGGTRAEDFHGNSCGVLIPYTSYIQQAVSKAETSIAWQK